MSTNKIELITVESLDKEVSTWVEQDKNSHGAWSMFILVTMKKIEAGL